MYRADDRGIFFANGVGALFASSVRAFIDTWLDVLLEEGPGIGNTDHFPKRLHSDGVTFIGWTKPVDWNWRGR